MKKFFAALLVLILIVGVAFICFKLGVSQDKITFSLSYDFPIWEITTNLIGIFIAIVTIIISGNQSRKLEKRDMKRESIRATLTDFTQIRREHLNRCSNNEKLNLIDDRSNIRAYIVDLERFATGINMNAYDLETVNKMSGGYLVGKYREYLRDYIYGTRLDPKGFAVDTAKRYNEFEKMIKDLYQLRSLNWDGEIIIPESVNTLYYFLSKAVDTTDEIFLQFRSLPNAIEIVGEGKQRCLYVPGTRKDRCVLVAHADTVYDSLYNNDAKAENEVLYINNTFTGRNKTVGIGADDRAGLAILWLLKDSGHSLLITDGEEHGQVGATYLREHNLELFNELNTHTFMLQLDRRNNNDFKCYDIRVTDEFIAYIKQETGFTLVEEEKGKTDIKVLCRDICGANLSVGYYYEHKPEEYLNINEWLNTLDIVQTMVSKPLIKWDVQQMS